MKVIGLNHGEINSSAAILINEKKIFGCPEERFTRQKLTRAFPYNALKYCLDSTKTKLSDCKAVAQGWNPGMNWVKFNPIYSNNNDFREKYFYSVADNLFRFQTLRFPGNYTKMSLDPKSKMPDIFFIKHHNCHAANAFFLSNFEEAAILTCDFKGEQESTTMSYGKNNNINNIKSQLSPNSLGVFYSTFTELLGYKADSDEWKVMALSAFDARDNNIIKNIRKTYKLLADGKVEFDQSYYKSTIIDRPDLYTDKLMELLKVNPKKIKSNNIDWKKAIAFAMQFCAEEIAIHLIKEISKKIKSKNLVVSGGFFMNSVFNGKILDLTKFKNLYVPYAPTDAGNSIGAALYTSHCIYKKKRKQIINSSFIGPKFSRNEILSSLTKRHIKFKTLDRNIEKQIAHLVSSKGIVAHFNDRIEFGDRALGNRSILADPRYTSIKTQINSAIKYRESFRPFAPVILEDKVSKYFDVDKNFRNPYMEKVVKVRKKYKDLIPAVVHFDNSCRVQTVNKYREPRLYKTLEEFEKITGIPIMLNTSFNVNGEPIVLDPDDAINTFYNSGLDILVMENYLIYK